MKVYSLIQIQPNYRIVGLNFISKTQVRQFVDFKGFVHGFDFKPFKEILQCQTEVNPWASSMSLAK